MKYFSHKRACTDNIHIGQNDVARIQVFGSMIQLLSLDIESCIPSLVIRISNELPGLR